MSALPPLAAVALGGLVGTGLRLGIDVLLPHAGAAFPLSTLVINLVGSLVLGLLVGRVWPVAPEWLRAALGAGLLGAFTTFSAISVSVVELAEAGAGWAALGYVAASVVGGIAAAALGLRIGSRNRNRTPVPIGPEE